MMKSLRDEICLWQMKSKPSLDEIKSTHPPSRRISSKIRFIPPEKVDLVEKDSGLYKVLSLFLVRMHLKNIASFIVSVRWIANGISARGGLSRQTVQWTVWSYGQIAPAIFSLFQILSSLQCKKDAEVSNPRGAKPIRPVGFKRRDIAIALYRVLNRIASFFKSALLSLSQFCEPNSRGFSYLCACCVFEVKL